MELLLQPRDRHHCGCGDKTRREETPRPDLDAHKWRRSTETLRPLLPAEPGMRREEGNWRKEPGGVYFQSEEGREEGREAPGAR